jgi:peroxin-1
LEILERSVRDCAGFEDQRAFNEDQLGLHAVAKATEGFSGADLRALATDAHMHAVHRAMECETPGDDEVVEAVVTREDVARAAREARRSVPARERERLDAVFAEFRGSRVGSGGEATPGKSPKRVSLA